MKVKQLYYLLLALIVLLSLALIGSAFIGKSILDEQSRQLSTTVADRQIIEEKERALARAERDIKRFDELNQIAKSVVPRDKDQAKTVREINAVATKNGIKLGSITFPVSSLGGAEGATSSEGQNSSPALTQLESVEDIKGVYAMEITVASDPKFSVAYPRFIGFLEGLESNRRTAHVIRINVEPDEDPSSVNFTLTLNAYVKPVDNKEGQSR